MNHEELSRSIAVMERALAIDDPALARRLGRLVRHDTMQAIAVVALLAIGAVLMIGGLGTQSIALGACGLLALSLSVAIDATHRCLLRRAPRMPAAVDRES